MFVEGAKKKVRYNPPLEQNRRPTNRNGLHAGVPTNANKDSKTLSAPSGDKEESPLKLIPLLESKIHEETLYRGKIVYMIV